MSVTMTHPESGESWTLEKEEEKAVLGWCLRPGTQKPVLTRVPLARCESGLNDEIDSWIERLAEQGFLDEEGYRQHEVVKNGIEVVCEIAGVVSKDALPEDLQSRTEQDEVVLKIKGSGDEPIQMLADAGVVRGNSLLSNISHVDDLITALRLQQTLSALDVKVNLVLPESERQGDIDTVTADRAAEWWPHLKPELERYDLWQPSVTEIVKKQASGGYWF